MNILITGSTGFIGRTLIKSISSSYDLTAVLRTPTSQFHSSVKQIKIDDITPITRWSDALKDISVVVHTAARVHILKDISKNPILEFNQTNTSSTINLASQAAKQGIKRFIFISSIGVNGNQTNHNPFDVNDKPMPIGPYAKSKLDAEEGLKKIANETGMEIVIIRPPLVYGPNAPGNFNRLINAISRSPILPLGSINNLRSLVSVYNLIDLIKVCLDHPNAANQTFLVSDDEDLSTSELIKRIANALGKPCRLLKIPANVIAIGATLVRKKNIHQQLCSSLQVDISHTKKVLNWSPPISVDEALKKTAQAYLNEKNI